VLKPVAGRTEDSGAVGHACLPDCMAVVLHFVFPAWNVEILISVDISFTRDFVVVMIAIESGSSLYFPRKASSS
jgi:hypothetical protein